MQLLAWMYTNREVFELILFVYMLLWRWQTVKAFKQLTSMLAKDINELQDLCTANLLRTKSISNEVQSLGLMVQSLQVQFANMLNDSDASAERIEEIRGVLEGVNAVLSSRYRDNGFIP